MTPDDTLAAFFAHQAPPTRDLVFQSRVAERVARRRAAGTVLAVLPWTIATAAVLWALAPLVAPVMGRFGEALTPVAAILCLTALTLVGAARIDRRLSFLGHRLAGPV